MLQFMKVLPFFLATLRPASRFPGAKAALIQSRCHSIRKARWPCAGPGGNNQLLDPVHAFVNIQPRPLRLDDKAAMRFLLQLRRLRL